MDGQGAGGLAADGGEVVDLIVGGQGPAVAAIVADRGDGGVFQRRRGVSGRDGDEGGQRHREQPAVRDDCRVLVPRRDDVAEGGTTALL